MLSNIELEGITVPAYTIENDLDGNYLLLYLKGPSGKPYLYQYDRQEKTLQRYTGSMTEKVNRGTTEQRGAVNFNNYVMVVILDCTGGGDPGTFDRHVKNGHPT